MNLIASVRTLMRSESLFPSASGVVSCAERMLELIRAMGEDDSDEEKCGGRGDG